MVKWHLANLVTHSPRLKINFEETITVKSYFRCSLSSLLDFWVLLEPFRVFFFRSSCSPCHGSIMSQLWPIGDDVPQLTHKLHPGFSITILWQYNFKQRSVCSALIEVLLLFTVGHRVTPPSPLSDFLFSVFSLYLLRISYMYF